MRRCVLLKHGEVVLKGRNRDRFEAQLRRNLRASLRGVGTPVRIETAGSVTVVSSPRAPEAPVTELVRRARDVMGFDVVQPAVAVAPSPEVVARAAVDLLRERTPVAGGFAVRARRRDKSFPLRSDELATLVGARVHDELGLPVDLTTPAVEVAVEVDRGAVHLSLDRLRGQGGLPVGCSGRAVVLLSGGYDSPVAAHRAMRRGLHCDFVHFTGAPYTGPASAYKAYALVRELGRYQPGPRLLIVPLGAAQRSLATAGAGRWQIVAQRRLMVRAAGELARGWGAAALVTGDSLGQVASQTLSNLAAVDEAAPLPVLRPLLGWDKKEIMAEAARIGTEVISQLPDEDCCRLFMPPRVATRSDAARLALLERRCDPDRTVRELLARGRMVYPGRDDTGRAAA
ncbi:tRNA uracil 4-sulfurtransferase ThiI [Streptantibioticus cattleyicolor]|uniref:Probable tRNA sulfurtransferase n=1 Tax=Streptantibioticus cattleyicolor (strain ATCC 35852 / DSM 46488 / JCM 4925 / NBRC 14057 / NRRL 8057) TaxID=1003195 RepID=F8JME5_STREN|nr:tRNA uracil 4-sulfurtransferase ThiI [Streptantibioticus cattleyicolor]AEW99376.1 thiazole biosynthesis/tRNA modification protein ThiI [Streptantibioticus cattleyicolor NRRL 8057 = DSM 46488]CCB71583.1 putative thiamine biosynthesis protein thiI [Streptantibioticus cattleyicolor NRRL 8057 = DSM 46488]